MQNSLKKQFGYLDFAHATARKFYFQMLPETWVGLGKC